MKTTVVLDKGNASTTSEASGAFTPNDSGITQIQQHTELGEAIDKLNSDIYDHSKNASSIDFVSNIPKISFPFIVALDALAQMHVLPQKSIKLTLAFKRNAPSIDGQGREQVVKVVAGRRDDEERRSFGGQIMDRVKALSAPLDSEKDAQVIDVEPLANGQTI